MGNPAYPICTLLEGLPIIKTRALKEDEANQDGLSQTCSVLARQYPELWAEIWKVSPHRRLWQESISVAIMLKSRDYDVLADRIRWLKQHPHPKLKCLISVHVSETRKRAQLHEEFKKDIQEGILSISICECCVDGAQALLQMLMGTDAEWITISSKELWGDFASLQLQIRRLAGDPSSQFIKGCRRFGVVIFCLNLMKLVA